MKLRYIFYILLLLTAKEFCNTQNEDIVVNYEADSIHYSIDLKKIIFIGNVKIRQGDFELRADTIVYLVEKKELHTYGTAYLKDKDGEFKGEDIQFNINNKTGVFLNASTKLQKGYFNGAIVERDSLGNLTIFNGSFTTCSNNPPHYSFASNIMLLEPNDKLIAKPVVLYIGKVPVFAIPFYIFTIKKGRHSGLLNIKLGIQNSTFEGRYINNLGYYYVLNDYVDFTTYLNLWEKRGWEINEKIRYKLIYNFDGNIRAMYGKYKYSSDEYYTEIWRVIWRHYQNFSPYSRLLANVDIFNSSKIFTDDNFSNNTTESSISSKITYNFTQGRKSFVAQLYHKKDIQNSKQFFYYPSMTFNLYGIQLVNQFGINLTASYNAVMNNLYTEYADEQYQSSIKQSFNLNAVSSLFDKIITMSSSLGYVEIGYFNHDNEQLYRKSYISNMKLNMSTKMYGIKEVNLFSVKAVRHVLTPSLSWNYAPNFYFNGYRYEIVNYSDSMDFDYPLGSYRNNLSLSLNNQWQIKYSNSENKIVKNNNFLSLNISSSVDLKKFYAGEDQIWNDINFNSRLLPGKIGGKYLSGDISFAANGNYGVYIEKMKKITFSYNTDLIFSGVNEKDSLATAFLPSELWKNDSYLFSKTQVRLSFNQFFTKDYITNTLSKSSKMLFNISFKPSKKWMIGYTTYYDLEKKKMVYQALNIYRDMHCWEMRFNWRKNGDYWNYSLTINIKELPDFKIFTQRAK